MLTLLASLGDETTGEQAPATDPTSVKNPGALWRSFIVTVLCAVLVVALMFLADSVIPTPGYRPARSIATAGRRASLAQT